MTSDGGNGPARPGWAGVEPVAWQARANAANERETAERERAEQRLTNSELNIQEELAERERRIAEYDAAAAERAAAQAARGLAEERRVADQRRDRRRFAWRMGAVLTSVVLSAAGVTIAAFAYLAPPEQDPVVVPAPAVTVLPAPVVVAPPR